MSWILTVTADGWVTITDNRRKELARGLSISPGLFVGLVTDQSRTLKEMPLWPST
jgi:hypothetical protein